MRKSKVRLLGLVLAVSICTAGCGSKNKEDLEVPEISLTKLTDVTEETEVTEEAELSDADGSTTTEETTEEITETVTEAAAATETSAYDSGFATNIAIVNEEGENIDYYFYNYEGESGYISYEADKQADYNTYMDNLSDRQNQIVEGQNEDGTTIVGTASRPK